MIRLTRPCALAIGLAFAGLAPPGWAADEEIGSWVLACPAPPAGTQADGCILRHKSWVLAPGNGGPSAALEVQMRGDSLVPVVALRGMPTQAAVGGSLVLKPDVAVRFDNGPRSPMSCGLSGAAYACAPQLAAIGPTAAALPKAHAVTVRIELTIPGMMTLPPTERTMELSGTEAALARLRAVGAITEALPEVPGLDWQGFLDHMLRAAGFANGAGDVLPKLLPLVAGMKG
jgi:hypothetical protein